MLTPKVTESMEKKTTEQLAHDFISLYNEYDLRISGKINNQTAYQLIEIIEQKYQTDTLQLTDGTHIWNLLRIFLYSNFQNLNEQKTLSKNNLRSFISLLKESFLPITLPQNVTICGFSSSESRKLYKDTYYDIYLDPLYAILGDKLAVFEWPETTGYRRKYDHPVFSKNYVRMHFPLWSKTFWDLLSNKLTGRKNFSLKSEKTFKEIIEFISTQAAVDKIKLMKDIHDFITVFVAVKYFLFRMLQKIKPKAVLIRCGYGRFPMALSEACRELNITSIEFQHGIITAYHPAYRRATPTKNKDCVPEYLLTQGEIYTELVREGNLFEQNKVITTGYPYLQQILNEENKRTIPKQSYSSYAKNILFTSQWILATEIQDFVLKVAKQLKDEKQDIGILFKPHPYDKNDYSSMKKNTHIRLINKYEDAYKLFSSVDIHATVYSTSGLEAIAFGTPTIFVDLLHMEQNTRTQYIVTSPTQFTESIRRILTHYHDSISEIKAVANLFFTPSPEMQFKKFFTDLNLL